jgi:nitroimidazol reductase NimA-like FMN-containing flavoprotein (pyridoxamine 5'-phosphate oxidase superfamily)
VSDALGPGARTRVRRLPDKARYDEASVYRVFDAAPFCHVVATVHGRAMALPTLHARDGRELILHGSLSNALLRAALATGEAGVTATLFQGLRLARSGFESSIAYESVVAFGSLRRVEDLAEVRHDLDALVDAVLPGRAGEVRAATDAELRRTLVVRLRLEEASVKVSAGPTEDSPEDQALEIWSGVVPAHLAWGTPVPSSDGAMAAGLGLPPSIERRLREGS